MDLLLLFLLNLLSNLFYFGEHVFQGWLHALFPLVSIVSLSALVAVVEIWILSGIRKLVLQSIERFIFLSFIGIHLCFILCDSFLFYRFGWILNQESLYILAETNENEVNAFWHTYMSSGVLFSAMLTWVVVIYLTGRLRSKKVPSYTNFFIRCFALLGTGILGFGAYSYSTTRNGYGVPQYTSLTRCIYGCYTLCQNQKQIRQLESICRDVRASLPVECDTLPHLVVVIGESSSLYHCSVYGYEKPTWPRMSARTQSEELIVFEQAFSAYDATNGVMRSVFSVDPDLFGHVPLFPAVYRKAGYHTAIYDNQYFLGGGISFLCDEAVSDALFDTRVDGPFQYDEMMISSLKPTDSLSLDIIHLVGQHFTYSDRYPAEFTHFQPTDYDAYKYNDMQREVIAHYDNAALYCDYVLDQIIRKFESQDCLVVFFSDHGEEVFEMRDYCGHCSAATSPDPSYLYRVPFFVWLSPLFSARHPDKVQNIQTQCHQELCTSNFASWLMTLSSLFPTSY